MLPSRGFVRSSQAFGLRHATLATTSSTRSQALRGPIYARSSRQFGTALRGNGRSFGRAASIGVLSGSRISVLAPAPAVAGVFSQPLLSSLQSRHASTQPSASAPLDTPPANLPSSAPAAPTDALPDLTAEPLLDGSSLLDMPEQIGYLHALGLDFGWGTTSMVQWCLEHLHVYTGLPWWASVATLALLFRVAIFKPSLTAAENSAKMQTLRKDPRYTAAMADLQAAASRPGPLSQQKMIDARLAMNQMHKQVGFVMWKTFVPLVNLPFAFGMFRLLRAMTTLPVPALEDGGLLWFKDLTVPDPYFLLPIASSAIMFLILKQNMPYLAPQQRQIMKLMQWVITPISLIITLKMNAGLTFFIFVGSVLQWVQSALWRQPWLRKWAGLPPMTRYDSLAGGDGGGGGGGSSLSASSASSTSSTAVPLARVAPGSTWQAPRTIATTARVSEATSATTTSTSSAAAESNNPITMVKEGYSSVMGKARERQASAGKKAAYTKAQEYEAKRALEEDESYFRRREEERQLKELKKKRKI